MNERLYCTQCTLVFPLAQLANEHHAATGHPWTWMYEYRFVRAAVSPSNSNPEDPTDE